MPIWIPQIDNRAGPRYLAIVQALNEDVAAGRLAPGTKLPPHRDLAWRLKLTVGTIARAYAEAERRGLVSGEVGRGTFITDPAASAPRSIADYVAAKALNQGGIIDMAVNRPAEVGSAVEIGAALARLATRQDLPVVLDYQIDPTRSRHSAAGARWLAAEGVAAPAERVVVSAGGQHALFVAIAAVSRPGNIILAEEFTYPGLKTACHLLDRRIEGLTMDAEGVTPEAVEKALAGRPGRVLYLMPTVHNPTTITMPEERRRAIVELARRYDALIIEDGVYAFLHDAPPPPLAALAPERTIYLSGLSKSVAPALRVGFLAAPEALVGRLAASVGATLTMVPTPLAEIAADLIESGDAAACAKRQRAEVHERVRLAASMLGAGHCQAPAAFNLWVELPPPWHADAFVAEAYRSGIAIAPTGSFMAGHRAAEAVRVSVSAPPDREALKRALRTLGGLLRVSPENCCMTV